MTCKMVKIGRLKPGEQVREILKIYVNLCSKAVRGRIL